MSQAIGRSVLKLLSHVVFSVMMCFTLFSQAANADLIAVSKRTDSFYSVNPLTGETTYISSSDLSPGATGLAFLDGTLYASDMFVSSHDINTVAVDLGAGTSTFVSDQDGHANWHGLASNETTGVLGQVVPGTTL